MANLIASNIFKQLIYYPETSLGVQSTDGAYTLSPAAYTVTGAIGDDEITLNFGGSTSYTIPDGTVLTTPSGDKYSVVVPDGTQLTGTASTASVELDRPLKAALSSAAVTGNYATLKQYVPKSLRRVSSNLDLKKETYSSAEIRQDQQIADQRTGANTVDGTISGELSSYTYNDFFGALLRRDFTTGYKSTSVITINGVTAENIPGTTTGVNTGASLTFTAGSATATQLSNVKTGDILVFKAFDVSTYINNVPMLVLDKTATSIKVVAATNPEALNSGTGFVTTASSQTSVTFEVLGKKTWIPLTGHTKQSFTFEHYYKDISDAQTSGDKPISELFIGARPTQASIRMPSSGIATVDFTFMGIGAKKPDEISKKVDGTSLTWVKTKSMLEQMTGDEPLTSGIDSIYTAAVGSIYIRDKKTGGTVSKVGLITSLDLTINGNGSTLKVIGSTTSPDVALGKIQVSGNMSIYFTDAKFRDMFLNEDEASIIAVFTENADNSINNSFMSFVMPRIKTGGASKDDAESIVMTVPFTALVGDGANGFEATTLQIQDYSQLA